MKDNFISEMNTFFNESPKCHLYRYIFDNNVLQFYLDRPLNYIYKPYICKMRISAHNLKIETGRFYNLDRHESRVVYGIGAIKRNIKNVAVFFQILRRKH